MNIGRRMRRGLHYAPYGTLHVLYAGRHALNANPCSHCLASMYIHSSPSGKPKAIFAELAYDFRFIAADELFKGMG